MEARHDVISTTRSGHFLLKVPDFYHFLTVLGNNTGKALKASVLSFILDCPSAAGGMWFQTTHISPYFPQIRAFFQNMTFPKNEQLPGNCWRFLEQLVAFPSQRALRACCISLMCVFHSSKTSQLKLFITLHPCQLFRLSTTFYSTLTNLPSRFQCYVNFHFQSFHIPCQLTFNQYLVNLFPHTLLL